MEQNGPLELGLKSLESKDVVRHNEFRFITSNFGFVNSFIQMEPTLLQIGRPYRIKEGRFTLVKGGLVHASINLIDYIFKAGTLFLIAPNSIIQVNEISPDFDAIMIAIDYHFLPIDIKEDLYNHFLHRKNIVRLTPAQEEWKQLEDYLTLMWNVLQEPVFRRKAVQYLLASLLYTVECIVQKSNNEGSKRLTRQEEIFQNFISLVNANSKTERNVDFYADKLCLTPRYLNTLIRQVSQQTIMGWINQSILLEAKVLLKHSNHLIYQISDELNFPNPSFFCKFFKRNTGMTPQEYQKS